MPSWLCRNFEPYRVAERQALPNVNHKVYSVFLLRRQARRQQLQLSANVRRVGVRANARNAFRSAVSRGPIQWCAAASCNDYNMWRLRCHLTYSTIAKRDTACIVSCFASPSRPLKSSDPFKSRYPRRPITANKLSTTIAQPSFAFSCIIVSESVGPPALATCAGPLTHRIAGPHVFVRCDLLIFHSRMMKKISRSCDVNPGAIAETYPEWSTWLS